MDTAAWTTSLDIRSERIELLVTEERRKVLHAQLSGSPVHPRALAFVLEGLALWSGKRLCVVIYADAPVHPSLGLGRPGDEWPEDNPLVEYLFVERPRGGSGRGRS
jgi:hypothetical protein